MEIKRHIKNLVSLVFSVSLTGALVGCLGGSGAGSSASQTSAGAASFVSSTVVDYDTVTVKLNLKGDLKIPGGTGFNVVKFYSNSSCSSALVGQGLNQDFSTTGIDVQLSSTALSQIYVSTNTVSDCFYLFDFLPHYDAPPAPSSRQQVRLHLHEQRSIPLLLAQLLLQQRPFAFTAMPPARL